MSLKIIDNISKIIAKMPGIGPRMAKRIVLHLAENKEGKLINLINGLKDLYNNIHQCEICQNLDENNICSICNDAARDKSTICIVEQVADLWAIERTKNYNGQYHILGGNLSALSGKSFEDLHLDKLYQRIVSNKVTEVIIATSATIDGQTTAYFIAENIKKYKINITRPAYGIPIGSEIDYLDDGTIAIAIKTRSLLE
jgi:recombination protein RecR